MPDAGAETEGLESFSAWIEQTDDHAAHRLGLVREVRELRALGDAASLAARRSLAERLERWRYQLLSTLSAQLDPTGEELAAALDLATNELAGRQRRSPRAARAAICSPGTDSTAIADAMACLDRGVGVEELSRRAAERTEEHFRATDCTGTLRGSRSMLLYAPIYLSNYCVNHCTYCGFRHPTRIPRKQLAPAEVLREAHILRDRGFRHVLLVAGDFPSRTNAEYFASVLHLLAAEGFQPGIEIAPQSTAVYAELFRAGACSITLYQETYDEDRYATYHRRGSKRAYDWRLEGLERAAEAGFRRLGLGVLLGLADPRKDLLALMRHGAYLQLRFPDRRLAFSLPRIHDAPAGFAAPCTVDDETFLRMYCALRIAFPQAMLVLSTREAPELRNRLARICITQMSAGSSTAPGGYEAAETTESGEQFPVCDRRTPAEVVGWLGRSGFHIDWSLP